MALSGYVITNSYEGRYYEVSWTATQSIANNTSSIQWTLKALGGSVEWYAERTLKVTVADKDVFTKSDRVERRTGTIASGYVSVAHDSNGNASFDISLEVAVYTSSINCRGSSTFTLNTIARATTPTVNVSSVNFGSKITISTPRAVSTYTHTLKYTFSGVSGTFATGVGTSYVWTVPADFMNRIPNATSGTITISCLTYDGSTLIGTKTVTFKATVPASVVPNINGVSVVEGVSGLADKFGVFIMDKSKLNVEVSAVGAYGSTIASYSTTFRGAIYTGDKFTIDSVNSFGEFAFLVTVKDSRGRTAKYEHTINVVDYLSPRIVSFNAFRCDELGEPDNEGNYLLIDYGHNITPLDNKNDKSFILEAKSSSDSSFSTINEGSVYFANDYIIIDADADDSYIIRLTVSDYFSTITREIEAPTAFTLVDYHESGKGISFGKVSEKKNAMEIGFTMYDKYDTLIGNGIASYQGSGAIDSNTTLETLFISSTNTPDDSLWYISQTFYNGKSATGHRMQYAIPYPYSNQGVKIGENKSHYRRNYTIGHGWGEWLEIPILVESGTYGVWKYEKWSDRRGRLEGKIPVESVAVQTALGAWYRSGQIYTGTSQTYPFKFSEDPVVNATFLTNNTNGALLWFLNNGTILTPPTCYLIRPVTSDGVNGYVHMTVEGTY